MTGARLVGFRPAVTALLVSGLLLCALVRAGEAQNVFPVPQRMEMTGSVFPLSARTIIVLPEKPSSHDQFLARFLSGLLSDRYGVAVRQQRTSTLPSDQSIIVMGTTQNSLVQQLQSREPLAMDEQQLGQEGYVLRVDQNAVVITAPEERGVFYGLQTLRQLIRGEQETLVIQGARIEDWPYKPFRGVRAYLPGREHLPYFRRFIRHFMALYKFNTLILEVGSSMQFDCCPELNAGWLDFAKDMRYTHRIRAVGPGGEGQDSPHYDTADGGVLERQEVADLAAYAARHHIEVIPEIPTLTHSYHLLTRHRELAAVPDAEWPDSYDPSNPKTYELVFDVLDEYIDVLKPRTIHIGHDEWVTPIEQCPTCQGKEMAKLFADDVRKIHDYLATKGIRTAMWGDHLSTVPYGKEVREAKTRSSGRPYMRPAGLSEDQMREWIPKDILVFHYTWDDTWRGPGTGETMAREFERLGMAYVYGNFGPHALDAYRRRGDWPKHLGAAVSSWSASNEFNFAKDYVFEFLGSANLLWSTHSLDRPDLIRITNDLVPEIRRNLSGQALPSEDGDPIVSIPLASHFNADATLRAFGDDTAPLGLPALKKGRIQAGRKSFDMTRSDSRSFVAVGSKGDGPVSLPSELTGIAINKDANSLIFLHALARPALREMSHWALYNFPDMADLLGWYEVVYEDGFVETVPIRYGVNILEWDRYRPGAFGWPSHKVRESAHYAYYAETVECGNDAAQPITCFAFEWVNPRFGKVIREVRVKGTTGFRRFLPHEDVVMPSNAILLFAISAVEKRPHPDAVRATSVR